MGCAHVKNKRRCRDKFYQIEIPLPPLAEQHRIVAKIERLAAKVEEALGLRVFATKALQTLLSSQITKLFENLRVYPNIPIGTLGIEGSNPVQTGPFGAQLHVYDFMDKGVPVLNVGNVWPEGLRLDQLDYVTQEKAEQLSRYSLKPGDLLFARSGATLGKVCIVPAKCNG